MIFYRNHQWVQLIGYKGPEVNIGGDENVLYLHCDGDYMALFICENSKNCSFTSLDVSPSAETV